MKVHILNSARPLQELETLRSEGTLHDGDIVVAPNEDGLAYVKSVCKMWELNVTIRLRQEGESHSQDWRF